MRPSVATPIRAASMVHQCVLKRCSCAAHHRHPDLLKGVYKMGFQKPSKIQERALPLLLQNPSVHWRCSAPHCVSGPDLEVFLYSPRNMIGQSQSGTGKTAAFALTMLSRVDLEIKQPQVSTACSQYSCTDLWLVCLYTLTGHLYRSVS